MIPVGKDRIALNVAPSGVELLTSSVLEAGHYRWTTTAILNSQFFLLFEDLRFQSIKTDGLVN